MSKRSIIRKRTVCFFACAALLLVGVLLAWILWPRAAAQTRAQAYRDGLDTYRYDLVFRPEQSTLAVTLTLDYTNRTGDTLQELVLRTFQRVAFGWRVCGGMIGSSKQVLPMRLKRCCMCR